MSREQKWLDLIKNLPTWIKAAIGLITLIIGFVSIFQSNFYLASTVSIATVLVALLSLSIYLASAKTPPLVEGGKGVYRFEKYRQFAVAGIMIIPIIFIVSLTLKPSRSFVVTAFIGTLTPPPTATPTNTPTQTSTLTPTSTYTSTKTPTPSPTPAPTQISTPTSTVTRSIAEVQPFSDNKLGVVVADFGEGPNFVESVRGKDIAESFVRDLNERIRQSGLRQVVIKLAGVTVQNEAEAKELGETLNATIVIWGRTSTQEDILFPNFTLLKVEELAPNLEQADLSIYYTPLNSSQTLELSNELSGRTTALASFIIGLIHMSNRDYGQAIVEFSRTIDDLVGNEVGSDLIYDYRGRAYYGIQDFGSALKDFEYALNLNPNNPSLYIGMGNVYSRKQDWPKATEMYQQALDIQSDYSRAYLSLGSVNAIQGNYQAAIEFYEQAIRYKPDYALAYYDLGLIHYRLGNKEESIAAYENSLKFLGTNESLKFAVENNLSLAKALSTPTPTLTPTPPAQARSTQSNPLDTISGGNLPDDGASSKSYPPPTLLHPSDGIVVVGGLIKFEWEWAGQLETNEYFDLKIRPIGDPNSIFVDWSKETIYILDSHEAPLKETLYYEWSIQVIKGKYLGEEKQLEGYLSPESESFVIIRGTEHTEPDDPGVSTADGGLGGGD